MEWELILNMLIIKINNANKNEIKIDNESQNEILISIKIDKNDINKKIRFMYNNCKKTNEESNENENTIISILNIFISKIN